LVCKQSLVSFCWAAFRVSQTAIQPQSLTYQYNFNTIFLGVSLIPGRPFWGTEMVVLALKIFFFPLTATAFLASCRQLKLKQETDCSVTPRGAFLARGREYCSACPEDWRGLEQLKH
jgi:hypothetical protein